MLAFERPNGWRVVLNLGSGAVDLPGRTWRDRPGVERGGDVFLAGDEVAAPGMLSEVSCTSAVAAVDAALSRARLR